MNTEPEEQPVVQGAYGSGKLVERINKDELEPLFKHDHEHEYAIDPDDSTDAYYSEMCVKCPMGRLIARN